MKDPLPHNQLPIAELDNLIVTPHVAGQTEESLRNVGRAATACIRQALAGHIPNTPSTPCTHPPPDTAAAAGATRRQSSPTLF